MYVPPCRGGVEVRFSCPGGFGGCPPGTAEQSSDEAGVRPGAGPPGPAEQTVDVPLGAERQSTTLHGSLWLCQAVVPPVTIACPLSLSFLARPPCAWSF